MTPVSWQGSLTRLVVAVMAGAQFCCYICKPGLFHHDYSGSVWLLARQPYPSGGCSHCCHSPMVHIHAPEPLRDDHPFFVHECLHKDVNVCMYVWWVLQHDPSTYRSHDQILVSRCDCAKESQNAKNLPHKNFKVNSRIVISSLVFLLLLIWYFCYFSCYF